MHLERYRDMYECDGCRNHDINALKKWDRVTK